MIASVEAAVQSSGIKLDAFAAGVARSFKAERTVVGTVAETALSETTTAALECDN